MFDKNMPSRLLLWYLNLCSTNPVMAQLHCGLYRWPLRLLLLVIFCMAVIACTQGF